MASGKHDITIDQGSDFSLTLTVKDGGVARNLSSWSVRGQLRSTVSSTDSTSFTIDTTDAATGILVVSLAHNVSRDMTAGLYVYDIEIFQGTAPNETAVTRLLKGRATLTGEVTR